MSQTTTALFYSTDPGLIGGAPLIRCLEASGATIGLRGSRATSGKSEWEAFKAEVEHHPKWERLGDSLTALEAAALVREGDELSLDLGSPPMARKVHDGVLDGIPPAIYGMHCPGNMSVRVGWHDIFDSVEDEEGQFFARASFSVSFWGNFVAEDIKEYRLRFFQLPAVVQAQQQLETALGPLGSCILLNV